MNTDSRIDLTGDHGESRVLSAGISLRNVHLNDVRRYTAVVAAAGHGALNLEADSFQGARQRDSKNISIPAWFGSTPEPFESLLTAWSMSPLPGFDWPGIRPLQLLTVQVCNFQRKAGRPHEQVGYRQRHATLVVDGNIAVEPQVCMSAKDRNRTEKNRNVSARG